MSFLHRELAYDLLSALGFPKADDSPVFSAPHASRRLQFYPHKTRTIKPTKVDRIIASPLSGQDAICYQCNTIARGVRRIATPFIYARQIRFALTRDHERSAALPDDASRLMRGARRGGMKSRGLRLAPRSCASQSASGTAPRHECGVRRTRTRPCGATRKFYKEAA